MLGIMCSFFIGGGCSESVNVNMLTLWKIKYAKIILGGWDANWQGGKLAHDHVAHKKK